MFVTRDTDIRGQLADWRERLESTIAETDEGAHLAPLLREINSTLERMNARSYGICESCLETINPRQMRADPLSRYCLDCLTADQLDALERDLHKAREVQGEMLPKHQAGAGGWAFHYHYDPAGPVSGDYCDVVNLDGGDLFFLLGDVSGKGIASSILMAHLRAIFRSLISFNLPVSELVARANQVFCESSISAYYATLVCGKADSFGEIEICNAGHCPSLLVSDGQVTSLESTGRPVGIFDDEQYSATKLRLPAGASLFLYSDGLTEARNPFDEEYGIERLSGLLWRHQALSAQALVQTCLEDLKTFQSGNGQTDDLTMMAIQRVE
jgi:sigma-B regulation protein RsbU (phosphoserine phosphatase)